MFTNNTTASASSNISILTSDTSTPSLEENKLGANLFTPPTAASSKAPLKIGAHKSNRSKHFGFKRSEKGRLTTDHSNPRISKYAHVLKKSTVYEKEFAEVIGIDIAAKKIEIFKELNEKCPISADGVLYDLIISYPNLTSRSVKHCLGIGNGRYYRVKNSKLKKKPGGLNPQAQVANNNTNSTTTNTKQFIYLLLLLI